MNLLRRKDAFIREPFLHDMVPFAAWAGRPEIIPQFPLVAEADDPAESSVFLPATLVASREV
ncbi:hypothetical protein ATN84_00055 [Paramesorhizobium deserti]|uniref:Uncharacterized protein n=1 Tax=Paramesorhizobium deserti TaxID=1494590 RepID=A0A135HYG5_9HYPH|nr:hypothetical protein ATN84_00055 [Paramesorhizobium deserti]